MSFPEQLFVIDQQIFEAMREDDVISMFTDMLDAGMAKLPFKEFAIRCGELFWFKGNKVDWFNDPIVKNIMKETYVVHRFSSWDYESEEDKAFTSMSFVSDTMNWEAYFSDNPESVEFWKEYAVNLFKVLLVSLLTKNISKETVEKKSLTKFGIGGKKLRFPYTTYIRIGQVYNSDGSYAGTGRTLRAHWRRGHFRKQHFGKGGEHVKVIFIEAVFVNSDEEYIPRGHYKVQ